MKLKKLAIAFFILIGFFAHAQNVEMSFEEWKKWQNNYGLFISSFVQPYDDGFLVTASKIISENVKKDFLLQVDENMKIIKQLELSPTWEYGRKSSVLGDYHIEGDTLTCLYCIYSGHSKKAGDHYFVQRVVYDLNNMELVSSDQLVDGRFLNDEKKIKNQMRDFNKIKTKWIDDFVLLEFSINLWNFRCFNFIIYDRNFNPLAEKRLIDTFMIKDAVPQDLRREYYYYDYIITGQGEFVFASSRQKLFELSTGTDIALYGLSKEGSKEFFFNKPLGNYNLDNMCILKYEDGKVLLYGLFATPRPGEDYTFDGCCTLECDMNNGEYRIVDWKEFDQAIVGTYKPDVFTEYIIRNTSNVYERSNNYNQYKIEDDKGWCMLWPKELYQFIDKDGKIQEIRNNDEVILDYLDNYTSSRSIYIHKNNGKMYYIGQDKEKLRCIDSHGNCSCMDLPDDYFYFFKSFGKEHKNTDYKVVYIDDDMLIQRYDSDPPTYRFGTHNMKEIFQ